jgi:hypothetical protein
MTNVTWFMERAQERLARAQRSEQREWDPILVKYDIECVIGYLKAAMERIDEDDVVNVCQWCGIEGTEDHPCAICVKG